MEKIIVDRDSLVNLLQTFYNQGFNDASHTTEILDVTEDANFQIKQLLEADHLEYERVRQQELEQAERDLIEWEREMGLLEWEKKLGSNVDHLTNKQKPDEDPE